MTHKDKLNELRVCCAVLSEWPKDTHAFTNATALVRELFTPTARPLLWIGDRDIENEYLVRSQDRTGANWHAFVKGVFIGVGATRDEAKAMCEANSQARFLEQMA